MDLENVKYTYKGFWIAEKDKKYYMISYNYSPLTKRKSIHEITKEEYDKYSKYVISFF